GSSRQLADKIAPHGIRLESLPDASLEDVFTGIRKLGGWTGRVRTAARLESSIRAELERVAESFKGVPSRSCLLTLSPLSKPPAPPFVALPGSYHDDLLRMIGQRNVARAGVGGVVYATMSLEAILQADPEVIIELDPDGDRKSGGDAEAREAW